MRSKKSKTSGTYVYVFSIVDVEATGDNLRKQCESKGITVNNIAEAFNITPQSVYKWFRGESLCELNHLVGLSEMLETDINELIKKKKVCCPKVVECMVKAS